MSKLAIKVEGLGKQFLINQAKSDSLRESLYLRAKNLLGTHSSSKEDFWALQNVSFNVASGEAVGIIGHNGAGKSTLLKILSRITEPTTGRFEIEGRVSSLLEVGTGFHAELTGKENIYLNGTLLGMRRAEIKRKFDEIVDFSGVEKFINTPVKHYSSGMKVRLAFSVAAHLEPEILIIDEVLAVGDAEFQRKCLGKMDEVSREEGRTILFVSHNMSVLENLCSRGILLNHGKIEFMGEVRETVKHYLKSEQSRTKGANDIHLSDDVRIKGFSLREETIDCFGDLNYEFTLSSPVPNRISDIALLFYNHLNERVGIVDLRHSDVWEKSAYKNEITLEGTVMNLPLIEGTYSIGIYLASALTRGDYLNLKNFNMVAPPSEFVPYATRHRGYFEVKSKQVIR